MNILFILVLLTPFEEYGHLNSLPTSLEHQEEKCVFRNSKQFHGLAIYLAQLKLEHRSIVSISEKVDFNSVWQVLTRSDALICGELQPTMVL